jgi:hypothetical protein
VTVKTFRCEPAATNSRNDVEVNLIAGVGSTGQIDHK